MKDVKLLGNINIEFIVPGKISKSILNSWTFGNESLQASVVEGVKEGLGLNTTLKISILRQEIGYAIRKSLGEMYQIKDLRLDISGTYEEKKKCPRCAYTPEDQEENYCKFCGCNIV